MTMTLGIAQVGYPPRGDVLAQVDEVARLAHERDTQLLAFPENLMCPCELTASELAELSEPLDGPFARGMCDIARRFDLWIVFTMYETDPAGGPPFNTAVVAGADGMVHGFYRKCHLYDAHGVRESDRMGKGSRLASPVHTPFCTLGLGICYDLRFPEVARKLALDGCDLVLYPTAWHDGPGKAMHWETLLRARAIENECFVAGICHADGRYVGKSHVFDPLGRELLLAGGSEAGVPAAGVPEAGDASPSLLTCEIDLGAVAAAREAMPVFEHRRADLYARISART